DLHRGVRSDAGADVAALDHDVAVLGQLALTITHHIANLGMAGDDGDEPVDLRPPDRRGDVRAGDEAAPVLVEVDRVPRGELAEPGALVERDSLAESEPGDGAIHRAGVEITEAQALGEAPRNGALSGPGRPVDRNDHPLSPSAKALAGSEGRG